MAVYLDFGAAIIRFGTTEATKQSLDNPSAEEIVKLGKLIIKEKYGNLFDMYKQITGEDPYEVPMLNQPKSKANKKLVVKLRRLLTLQLPLPRNWLELLLTKKEWQQRKRMIWEAISGPRFTHHGLALKKSNILQI